MKEKNRFFAPDQLLPRTDYVRVSTRSVRRRLIAAATSCRLGRIRPPSGAEPGQSESTERSSNIASMVSRITSIETVPVWSR